MVASDGFADFLRDQLASLGRVTLRRMFGKSGVFCDGLMLGMVTDDTLYFRVDDLNRAEFKEAEAFPPLNYEKQGSAIDLSFWRAPGPAVRRARRACRLGAAGAGGGASGRGEASTAGAAASIKAAAEVVQRRRRAGFATSLLLPAPLPGA